MTSENPSGTVRSVAMEILELRNEVERLEGQVELRNRILAHLDDDSDAETIVTTMRGALLRALLDAVTPPSGRVDGGHES